VSIMQNVCWYCSVWSKHSGVWCCSASSLPSATKCSLCNHPVPIHSAQDAFGEQPFVELLQAEGLSDRLQDFVLYAIAFADCDQRQPGSISVRVVRSTMSTRACLGPSKWPQRVSDFRDPFWMSTSRRTLI
jgi:hypothetical protein